MSRGILVSLFLFVSGCSTALTDNAVLLVEDEELLEFSEFADEQFSPHIGVSVTTTRKPSVFHAWGTEEKWRLRVVPDKTEITGDNGESVILCNRGEGRTSVTLGLTHRGEKTIYLPKCSLHSDMLPYIVTHEVGHMVGASDCQDGVMTSDNPETGEPSEFTIKELREIYD
jgi:hypothetical protein